MIDALSTGSPSGPTDSTDSTDPADQAVFGRADTMLAADVADADPYGDDLQLALYTCYELHYRSFGGVDEGWEWNPALLGLRNQLEAVFLGALRRDAVRHTDVDEALEPLLVEPVDADGISHFLRKHGELSHLRDHIAMRAAYHLKEADPHAWVIPRLQGVAKASLVAVEFDEFGAGRADRAHSRLFADLMDGLGLDTRYGHYLDRTPAVMLAVVNLMSMLGLHRSLRGALVGHLAAAEITTSPSARRITQALDRLGTPDGCRVFYDEHIEADAVHEQVMRHDVIGDLISREPELTEDVIFGIDATEFLEEAVATEVLRAWRAGRSALRDPGDSALCDPAA
ncbi:Iron-containing redox enzyme [Actinopolymorpha cephalotaxi]|uniref:Iron-containing redox enzyme n=2 Tax=Actinopolymorpha cephalotaxi TaxID=504797 RepID=A0A1I2ZYT3_9ACTN|nr:Iron-containing redox enzyme [Actinopolymorpha cephalotaxi]